MTTSKNRRSKRTDRKRSQRRQSTNIGLWITVGGALLVAAVVILISVNQSTPTATPIEAGETYEGLPSEWINHNVLGDPNAPVTLQVWEDFL